MEITRYIAVVTNTLLVIIIFLTISCGTNNGKKYLSNIDSAENKKLRSFRNGGLSQDISTFKKDTLIINNEALVKTSENNKFQCLTRVQGDTIIKLNDYYSDIKFLDINEDGFKDIRVFINSSTPNQCINYFFDKKTMRYKEIQNCTLDIQLLKGTIFFYSYNATGCGDMNWESHLSIIENWTEINIGNIDVKDCGDKDDRMNIYKIDKTKKKLIASKPKVLFKNFDKWAFINNYWRENHNLFK